MVLLTQLPNQEEVPAWALAHAGGEICGKTVGLRDKGEEYIFLNQSPKSDPGAVCSGLENTSPFTWLIHGSLLLKLSSTCLQADALIPSSSGWSYPSLACVLLNGSQMEQPAPRLPSD